MTIGSLLNARFVPRFGAAASCARRYRAGASSDRRLLVMGSIEARYGCFGLWPFLPLFVPQIAANSLIGANAMAMALQRYPHMAGTASSLDGRHAVRPGRAVRRHRRPDLRRQHRAHDHAMGAAGILCWLSNRFVVPREHMV